MIFGSDILRIVTVYSEHTFVCFWIYTPDSDFALRLSYIIYNEKISMHFLNMINMKL